MPVIIFPAEIRFSVPVLLFDLIQALVNDLDGITHRLEHFLDLCIKLLIRLVVKSLCPLALILYRSDKLIDLCPVLFHG